VKGELSVFLGAKGKKVTGDGEKYMKRRFIFVLFAKYYVLVHRITCHEDSEVSIGIALLFL